MLVRSLSLFQSHGVVLSIVLGALSVLALVFLLVALYLRHCFPDLLGIAPPLHVKRAAYCEVIQGIVDGRLSADSFFVHLPPDFPDVAPQDRVLCERQPNGRLWVLFPLWYGRGSDLQGYLYSNAPFRPHDFIPDDGRGPAQHLDICGLNDLAATQVDANWCWVIRRMD